MAVREVLATYFGRIRKRIVGWRNMKAASVGQSIVIMAMSFLGIIAFVGFVVDTGIIYLHRVWLGQAVDAASLAAGYELPNVWGSCARAVEYLQANGYQAGVDFNFQLIYPSRPDAPNPPGDPGEFEIDSNDDAIINPQDCASVVVPSVHDGMHFEVRVSATQKVPVIFMHILGFGSINVTAPSTAARSDRYDIVLILDRSGSMKFDTCSLLRPIDEYGCQNRYKPCSTFYSEDFEAYDTLAEVEAAGWTIVGNASSPNNVNLKKPGDRSIEMTCKGDVGDPGSYTYDFSCVSDTINDNVEGFENVLLQNCQVNGNVEVADGHLDILSSLITGNVIVTDSYLVLDRSFVNGNVEAYIDSDDEVSYVIVETNIDGSVKADQGGKLQIVGNTIGGSIEADCPTVVIEASGNNVDGSTTLCGDDPGGVCGAFYRTISTVGYTEDVALFFTVEENSLNSDDALQVYWRPNSGVGWSQIAEYGEADIPDGVETPFGVMLPSAAYDNADLQIRFEAANSTSKWLRIDQVQLRICPDTVGPWVWYESDNDTGCRQTRPMACESDDWNTLQPGVSVSGDEPPVANLMEQPMLDALLAADAFVDIVDARRPPGAPPEDQIGLVAFDSEADKLLDLTTDYEAIKEELFTNFRAWGGTNFGGAMRAGLSILGDGRWNSAHYMILLSDGWPNFYDEPYADYGVSPTSFGINCGEVGNVPCTESLVYIDEQIEAANAQNVTIFTIGLGADVETKTFDASDAYGAGTETFSGMDILERISTGTNGVAYHAPTTEELETIFSWIAEAIFIRITR